MTLQVISLNQSFASYFMHGLTAISSLLSLEWKELLWDLGPNIRLLTHSQPQEISYSFSFCHLGVPHNRVILCCHMLQLHKTNNLFTGYKDHKETRECERCKSSFVHDQHKWGDRPSLETPLFEVPPGQVVLHRERGFCELWGCSRMWGWWVSDSAPVMAPVQQST